MTQLRFRSLPRAGRRWSAHGTSERNQPNPLLSTISDVRLPAGDRAESFSSASDAGTAERVQWPSGNSAEKLVVSPDVLRLVQVQYSKLAAALHQLQHERGVKVLLTTSAAAGEGKTLTIVNVALTFAELYHRRVLVVDADLRASMVHEVFGIPNTSGLSDLRTIEGPLPTVDVSPLLSVLPAGQGQGDPMKTLTSDRMRVLLDDARTHYDWILLDTPPVGLMPDAKSLGSITDGGLLVARAASTSYEQIQRAAAGLRSGISSRRGAASRSQPCMASRRYRRLLRRIRALVELAAGCLNRLPISFISTTSTG